jgi:hypothetical protein
VGLEIGLALIYLLAEPPIVVDGPLLIELEGIVEELGGMGRENG